MTIAVKLVPIGTVIPYDRNPRRNLQAVEKVRKSIEAFGWRQPIVVDHHMVVIAGHTRLLAARKLGCAEVPVHVAEGLTEAQVRAYRLADNRSHEEAAWDPELLGLELQDLQSAGFDLALTAFDDSEVAELLKGLGGEAVEQDPDFAPALPKSARSRHGDTWILGPHRLRCGDATSPSDVAAATDGGLADIVWTDPPYNVAYQAKAGKILNDDLKQEKFAALLRGAFLSVIQSMKPGASIYVAHADTEGLNFRAAFTGVGFKLAGCVIWKKDSLVLGRSDYQWQHEPILYGWKPGAGHRWFGGRKQTTIADLGMASPFSKMPDGSWQIRVGDRVLVVDGAAKVEEMVPSVLYHDRPKKSELHPTQKPVALIERMLKNSARSGDLVLDAFGGSGSTMIAADRLGMYCGLVELDPCYADVIVERWQTYTGRQAQREADGEKFNDVEPAPAADAA